MAKYDVYAGAAYICNVDTLKAARVIAREFDCPVRVVKIRPVPVVNVMIWNARQLR